MICVIVWSESRTFRSAPSPSGVVVCALGVKLGRDGDDGGIVELSSTTVSIPSLAARFSRTA